jgi:hypothetical protein
MHRPGADRRRLQVFSLKLVQQQLGHSTLSTTADIYTSVDEEQVTETAHALGKALVWLKCAVRGHARTGKKAVNNHTVSAQWRKRAP